MRVARSQAARALDAVRRRHRRAAARGRAAALHARPRSRGAGHGPRQALHTVSPRTIEQALAVIDDLPPARVELVETASARLASGERLSAGAIADMAVRRATCDLLR
jgi:hypothetical protein